MADKALMEKVNMLSSMSQGGGQMQQQMMMQMIQQDQRLLEVFMAMQGMDINTMSPEDMGASPEPPKPPPKKEEKKEEPPEDLRTPEQKEADEFKTKGNELYKKK